MPTNLAIPGINYYNTSTGGTETVTLVENGNDGSYNNAANPLGSSLVTNGGVGVAPQLGPLSVPGCVLWLRADSGITLNGTTVSQWNDNSGYGNNCLQGTANQQPLWVANGISGLPSLSFSTGISTALFNTTFTAGSQPNVLYVVAQQTNQSNVGLTVISFGTNAFNANLYNNSSTTLAIYNNNAGNQVQVTFNTQQPFISSSVLNASNSFIRANGSSGITGAMGTAGLGQGYYVGCLSGGSNRWDNLISEIIIYQGQSTVNPTVLAYLNSRYGISG